MADSTFTGPNGLKPYQHFALVIGAVQPTQEDAMLAGQYLRGAIRDRCFADEDLMGGNFIPYSPAYAKTKGQQNVDLYSRGRGKHMLDALTVRADPDGSAVEIGIYGDEDMAARAKLHNEGGAVKTRQGTGKHIAHRKSRQFGADIRRQKKGGQVYYDMPQRAFLGATQDEQDKMQEIVIDQINERLGRL